MPGLKLSGTCFAQGFSEPFSIQN